MNQFEFIHSIFSAMVNQALLNRSSRTDPLPQDQYAAQEKILDALHDLIENKSKIKPEYQQRVMDAMVLKIASEIGWFTE